MVVVQDFPMCSDLMQKKENDGVYEFEGMNFIMEKAHEIYLYGMEKVIYRQLMKVINDRCHLYWMRT